LRVQPLPLCLRPTGADCEDVYIDIAKVQIWCAFAETVLGEAAFDPPVK